VSSSVLSSTSLGRRLGPVDAAAIVISNVIGVGIFTTPGIIARMLPSSEAMLSVWLVGGLLAFGGALAYAELAARRPEAGGEYVYLRESFGPLAAFLTGWTSFVAGFSGAIAAGAVGATAYLERLTPSVAQMRTPIAIAIIVALALVHARGLGPGRLVQNALTMVKVGALVVFIVAGFVAAGPGVSSGVARGAATARSGMWLLALVPVMFSYAGWNAAVYVAEEVRDPARNVPRALALGTTVVVGLFLGLNLLYLRVVPPDALAGTIPVGEVAAGRLFGSAAAGLFAAIAVVIMLGSLSAMTLAGPRVYFAMARDGLFPARAGQVHDMYRTPAAAILAQAAWSTLLVLSGTFEQLLTYTGFAVILFSALAVLSLFFVRHRAPDASRFRAWGYPWAPALFVIVSFAIVANTFVQEPAIAFAGVGVIGAGIPIYALMRRRDSRPSNRARPASDND
jgi:basic amino acid/polyamine antiporter, APA family